MITYIQKDCKEYVELELELDASAYPIGSTLEDYEDGKWIKLSDEQLQFKQDNPDATKEEVIEMKLTPDPAPSPDELLREAKHKKEREIYSKAQEYYKYYLDDTDIFVSDTLRIKDKCARTDEVSINNKIIPSDILVVALDDMVDYSDLVVNNENSKIKTVSDATSVDDVEAVDINTGYPEIIRTTTKDLEYKLDNKNHNSESYQAAMFARAMINTVSLDANDALEMQILFPIWGKDKGFKVGDSVKVGNRCRVVENENDVLWECIKEHVIQENWKPSISTASLWVIVEAVHAGTKEDPIPYKQMMKLDKGKFYTQYDVLYECIQATVTGMPYDLKDMPSQVKVVE